MAKGLECDRRATVWGWGGENVNLNASLSGNEALSKH
jgi:hypothetical protein